MNFVCCAGVKAIQWGVENERTAINEFALATGLTVMDTGLWLHPNGYLGASPDGLVGDDAIVEVKCPYSVRAISIEEAVMTKKNFFLKKDGFGFSISEDHPYFHQIQGILYITGRSKCFFIVYSPKQTVILTIEKKDSWITNVAKLSSFYTSHMLPHIMEE